LRLRLSDDTQCPRLTPSSKGASRVSAQPGEHAKGMVTNGAVICELKDDA
jgi:hypothetical protein